MAETNKYNKTVFYKIVCKDENIKDLYVGHTTDFKERLRNHKSCCCNPHSKQYTYRIYTFIRENGGWDNFKMVIVEERNMNNKKEAEDHERYLINILEANLNSCIPGRNKQESDKQYRIKNKDRIQEAKHLTYLKHKEVIKDKNSEYYVRHKEEIKHHMSKPYECPHCKLCIQWSAKARHERSNKHHVAVSASQSSESSDTVSLPSSTSSTSEE